MLHTVNKLILISVLTIGAGIIFTLSGQDISTVNKKAYPEHLVGAFTGGFGEQTCHSCHFDYDLNWKKGHLSVSGIPEKIEPGGSYEIEIMVERKDLGKAGFQMTARYPDGSQAGQFLIKGNNRVMFTREVPDSLQFAQHSAEGTEPIQAGRNLWSITWEAPTQVIDSVQFNIASNAANGDQSEFGDWIYAKEIKTK